MGCHNKCSFTACSVLGIITSVIFGVVVGVLFGFGLISLILILPDIWIALGLAVLTLIFLVTGVYLAASTNSEALRKCLRRNTACLLIGIFGTIIIAIILLSIVLAATIAIAIIVGLGAFFLIFMFIGLISLISCIVCELNNC